MFLTVFHVKEHLLWLWLCRKYINFLSLFSSHNCFLSEAGVAVWTDILITDVSNGRLYERHVNKRRIEYNFGEKIF